jgi:hypothetical protein
MPNQIIPCSEFINGKLEQIDYPNIQWFEGQGVVEVEHLHSSFLYRMDCTDIYPYQFTNACFREDTVFSYEIFRKGFKTIVDKRAVTWHYKSQGGCRANPKEAYEADEAKFNLYLEKVGVKRAARPEILVISHALGDTIAFKNMIEDIKTYYSKPLKIATAFPNIFDGIKDIKLIPMGEAQILLGPEEINKQSIYNWMAQRNWKGGLSKAFKEMYCVGRTK